MNISTILKSNFRVSAIVFDLDNTLIDRDRAFHDWLSGKMDPEPILKIDQNGHASRELVFEEIARRADSGESAERWREKFQVEFPACFRPDPRILALLLELQKKADLAILSNGGSTLQRAKIKCAGLNSIFCDDDIFISEEIGYSKPDDKAFKVVIEHFGVPANEILFVGDQPEIDIKGATDAGMQAMWMQNFEDILHADFGSLN